MAISSNTTGLRPGVCTSTSRPSSPYEGQMIYETDTDKVLVWNGTAWYPSWNRPWGVVDATAGGTSSRGFVNRTSGDITLTTTRADLTGMTITFTPVAGRLYRCNFNAYISNVGTAQTISLQITDGSNAIKQTGLIVIGATQQGTMAMSTILSGLSGSTTLKVRGACLTASNAVVAASAGNEGAAVFSVEDIGPV